MRTAHSVPLFPAPLIPRHIPNMKSPSPSPQNPPSQSPRRWFSCLAAVAVSAVASPAANAQAFSGTYTFGADGNVASFPYNGTPITNLTVSPITKDGITTTSSSGNFRATQWPLGATTGSDVFTGTVNTGKYIQFTLTAAPGKLINLPSLTFGVGRSAAGPRQWQWRSSVDGYAAPIPVTTVNAGLTHNSGVLTNPDVNSSWTGNVIDTAGASYQNLSSITFRLYGYNAEDVSGTAGLQGPLTFGGTLIDTEILSVSVSPSTFSESATNPAATGTVTRTGDTSSALTVNLASSDTSEATVPATVEIPAGEASTTFDVTAVDDSIPDGDVLVTITASALSYSQGSFQITVQDDGDLPLVVISQYYEGLGSDKYIELHNPNGTQSTLTGYRLTNWTNENAEAWKSGGTPANSLNLDSVTIPAGGYFLIRGSGATAPLYAVALADLTDSGVPAGFNGNDSIVLYSSSSYTPGNIVDAISLTNLGNEGENKSFYRLSNGLGYSLTAGSNITTFPTVWGQKTLAEVAAAQLADPWLLRGLVAPSEMSVSITPTTFSEAAGADAAIGTVTIPSALGSNLVINLSSSDTSEATVPASVTIPAGETTVQFSVTAVDDPNLDGDQTVAITATALGYLQVSNTLTVTDEGDEIPAATLSPGAIAFIGYNADGNDDLAFVALVPIPEETVILFTDNEWNGQPVGSGGAFNTGEGFLTWTAPEGGVPAGTVVTLNSVSLISPSANLGSLSRSGTFNVNADNETIYAYQGSIFGASGFLSVIATHNADSTAGTGLLAQHIIYLPDDVDVAIYTGSRSNQPSYAAYLALIGNTATNWITEDGTGDQSSNGIPPDLPFDTTPFTLATPGGNTFADWIGDFPAVGDQTGFNDDFDNDGLANALENILGSSPAEFNQGMSAVVSSGGNIVFQHTLNAEPASDLVDSYEWSTDLVNWQASGASAGGTTVTFGPRLQIADGPPALVEVAITVTGTPATKIFARLRVDQVAAP